MFVFYNSPAQRTLASDYSAHLFPSYSFLGITLYVMYRLSILIMSGFSIHALHYPPTAHTILPQYGTPPPTLYIPLQFLYAQVYAKT